MNGTGVVILVVAIVVFLLATRKQRRLPVPFSNEDYERTQQSYQLPEFHVYDDLMKEAMEAAARRGESFDASHWTPELQAAYERYDQAARAKGL